MTELDSLGAVFWEDFGVAIDVCDGSGDADKLKEGASRELKLAGTGGKEVAGLVEFEQF